MSSARKAFVPRTLLLLSEDASVAEQIEQALATYCLTHHIQWHRDLHAFQQSLIGDRLRPASAARVDLVLIAYVDDVETTRHTLADLRRLTRWSLVPSVVFLREDDPVTWRMLYHQGANTVLRFPLRFDTLRRLISTMDAYWFDAVTLPYPTDDGD